MPYSILLTETSPDNWAWILSKPQIGWNGQSTVASGNGCRTGQDAAAEALRVLKRVEGK